MRRAWALVGACGVSLAAAGQLELPARELGPSLRVASALLLAALARCGATPAYDAASVASEGALAFEAARPLMPLVASGLLLSVVFATRAMRASSWRELALHVTVAFAGGVAASWVVRADDRLEVALWLLAITIAALLSSVPWLLPRDSVRDGARVRALRRLAALAERPLRGRLLRAAAAARRIARSEPHDDRARRAIDEVLAMGARRAEGRGSRALEEDLFRAIDRLCELARAASRRDRKLLAA